MHFLIPHGWRARLFQLSLHPRHLALATAGILLAGFLGAAWILSGRAEQEAEAVTLKHYFERGLQEALHTPGSQPRALAGWLHDVTTGMKELAESLELPVPTIERFNTTGRLFGIQVQPAIQRHAGPLDQQSLFHDYVVARIDSTQAQGKEAWKRIEAAALRQPAAPLANEFLGYLLEAANLKMEALNAFRREGAMPDAVHARSCVLEMAVDLEEARTLSELIYTEPYQSEASAVVRRQAGLLLGDFKMCLLGTLEQYWQTFQPAAQVLALLAAVLWYAVFISFTPRQPWRWLRMAPAIVAGIASVWPTLALLHYQENIMGFVEGGRFPQDLLYFVLGVGLREELSKLALFALLLPKLLRKRDPAGALIAGACVGLGFAWEENTGYYAHMGAEVAIGRFLTANFMHASMTGLSALALYEMVRTRFGRAEQFVATFFSMIAVHGLYDWVQTAHMGNPGLGDISLLSVLILALLAHRFFDELQRLTRHQRGFISLVALFVLGVALLIAASLMVVAADTGSWLAVIAVAVDALGLLPVMILYMRRFHHT